MVACRFSSARCYRLDNFVQIGGDHDAAPLGNRGFPAKRRMMMIGALVTLSMLDAGHRLALAEDQSINKAAAVAPEANTDLLKKLELMEKRIQALEAQLKQKEGAPQNAQAATAPTGATASIDPAKKASKSGAGPWWANTAETPETVQAGSPGVAQPSAVAAAAPSPAPGKPILDMMESPVAGLSIGAYGEVSYGFMQNPAANGQWQNGFDAHRLVLLPTYQITPNIIFNAEIEFEHAGTGFDADDKLHGTAEIEQVWVDFKIVDYFNVRAPGIDLVPIGYINEHHEPTQFYSVNRPELYNGLIPSTWKAPATSLYGTIADGLDYQVQASSSLEDFGDDFGIRGDDNKVPRGPYAAGINGQDALEFSLPVRGDFKQLSNTIAIAGRLGYSPSFIPGFSGSTSAYYSPNTTPRGAHASVVDPGDPSNLLDGAPLGNSSLAMVDTEFRYRVPATGLELRGEGVFVTFGNPANLHANNDGDPTNNVGKTMYGASAEIAYHFPLGTVLSSEWEAVPFYRYTYENLQTSGFAGIDPNLPNGSGQLQFHTAGIAVFPSPKIVIKGTYQKVSDAEAGGAKSDSVLGGVGFFF